ncbi:MAG: transcriptional repressor LexA [Clostridiaceae bacterium]
MKENLERQMKVYHYIKSYQSEKGYPPSVREICKAIDIKSTSTVFSILNKLEKNNFIKRDKTKPRAIEILDNNKGKKEMIDVPILGKIAAGNPILAFESIEDFFPLPMDYVKSDKDLFMLHVSGESMIEAGILNGDLAIIEKTNSAENGDKVVALIENEATLKTFYKERDYIRLQPENQTMDPIIVSDCSILGKLVGLYREY